MRVKNYGIAKEFQDRYDATELLRENGVSLDQIVADAKRRGIEDRVNLSVIQMSRRSII